MLRALRVRGGYVVLEGDKVIDVVDHAAHLLKYDLATIEHELIYDAQPKVIIDTSMHPEEPAEILDGYMYSHTYHTPGKVEVKHYYYPYKIIHKPKLVFDKLQSMVADTGFTTEDFVVGEVIAFKWYEAKADNHWSIDVLAKFGEKNVLRTTDKRAYLITDTAHIHIKNFCIELDIVIDPQEKQLTVAETIHVARHELRYEQLQQLAETLNAKGFKARFDYFYGEVQATKDGKLVALFDPLGNAFFDPDYKTQILAAVVELAGTIVNA